MSPTFQRSVVILAVILAATGLVEGQQGGQLINPAQQIQWAVMTGFGDPTATCQGQTPPPPGAAAPGQFYFDQTPPNAVSECLVISANYKWVKNPVLPQFGAAPPNPAGCTGSTEGTFFVNTTPPTTYYICHAATWVGPFGATGATGPMGPGACVVWRNTWTSNTSYAVNDCYYNGSNNYHVNTGYTSGATFGTVDTTNTVIFGVASSVGIAGLSSDGNNGTVTAGSVQVGTHEYTITCKNTAADGIAIANAFTAGGPGTIVKLSGGTCLSTNQIINLQSYDTLDGQGSTTFIFQPSSLTPYPYTSGYLQNVSSQAAPNRTFTDAVTTTMSNVLTSATAAFTSADAGRTLQCNGVVGAGGTQVGLALPNTYWTAIRYINSATSVQLVDPIPLATTGTTCSIYARDAHISLKGMKIISNGPACGSGAAASWWVTYFAEVNGLFLEDITFQDGTTGTSTSAGCKSININAASNIHAHNVGFATWVLLQDGFDFFGDVSDVMLDQIHGFTGDDMIAFYAAIGGFSPGFPQGPMHNLTLSNSDFGTSVSAIKLLGATGIYMPVIGVTIRDLHCRETYPNQSAIGIWDGLFLYEGTFDNLLIDGMSGYCQHVLTSPANAYHLTIRNVASDALPSSSQPLINFGHLATSPNPVYGDVVIDGLTYNGPAGGNGFLVSMDGTQTFNSLTISNSSLTNYAPAASVNALNLFATSIGTLNFINNNWQLTTGGAVTSPVRIGPANGQTTTMALNTLNIVHNTATVPAATPGWFPLYQLYNMANPVNVNVVDTVMTSAGTATSSTGFLIRNLSNAPTVPTVAVNYSFLNSAFINVTGCIYTSGATPTGQGSNVQAAGMVTSGLNVPGSCPANGQFNNPSMYGFNAYGVANHYDSVNLAALSSVNTANGSTATTGGTLPDATQYFYKWCSANSVGYACSVERSVTTGSSGTNTNTITITTQVAANAFSYTLARSTTSGAEQACTGFTAMPPSVGGTNLVDTGVTCSGATMPATNTTLPIQTGLLKGNGPAPTLTWGTGAGATAPGSPTITGNQHSFNVQFFTTATPAASATLFTMPVSLPDSGCPTNLTFSAANAAIGAFIGGLNWSCAGSTITVTMGSSALTASTTYKLGVTLVW